MDTQGFDNPRIYELERDLSMVQSEEAKQLLIERIEHIQRDNDPRIRRERVIGNIVFFSFLSSFVVIGIWGCCLVMKNNQPPTSVIGVPGTHTIASTE